MKTEKEIKAMCTPDIIKKMVELAEGWNKKHAKLNEIIHITDHRYFVAFYNGYKSYTEYYYVNYQPESLTALECALLHCLIEILKMEK